jgi:hypothetical protein
MGGKRKTEGGAKKGPAKKKKSGESPLAKKDEKRVQVSWALPATSSKDNTRNEDEDITKYARTLFQQSWDEIQTRQKPFRFPALRTPVYKAKGKDLEGEDAHKSSAALREFFNTIKHDTEVTSATGPYTRRAFNSAFDNARDHIAIVASRSTTSPILALDQDYRFEVTVREDDDSQTAHADIIHFTAPAAEGEEVDSEYGYFIELPPDGRITVNGRTYINGSTEEDDEVPPSPFLIGPLRRYTIVELLSQPFFFFYSREDLSFTDVLKGAKNAVSEEELSRRDTNGDVGPANVQIVWQSLEHDRNEEQPGGESDVAPEEEDDAELEPQPEAHPDEQDEEDTGTETGTETGAETEEETAEETGEIDEDRAEEPIEKPDEELTEEYLEGYTEGLAAGLAQGRAGELAQEDAVEVDTEGLTAEGHDQEDTEEDAEQSPAVEYDDTWTGDTRSYLESGLYGSLHDRYYDLLPHVILSINERQEPLGGFSVIVEKLALRPGRTLIKTLEHPRGDHHVLLVFRIPATKNITLQVLDAMAWKTTKEHRQTIHNAALQVLIESDWGRNVFPSVKTLIARFPKQSQWIDCAQHDDQRRVDTFTILNGLALAMGLELNETFNVSDGPTTFHDQAHLIFESAMTDRLDWKLLYAFLISTKYIKQQRSISRSKDKGKDKAKASPAKASSPTVGDTMLPPLNRRFDLRVRSYLKLLDRRLPQDEPPDDGPIIARKTTDIQLCADQTELRLGAGQPHDNDFNSDEWSEDFRRGVVIGAVRRGRWRISSTREQLELLLQAGSGGGTENVGQVGQTTKTPSPKSSANPGGKVTPSRTSGSSGSSATPTPKGAVSPGPSIDLAVVPHDFDACKYFRTAITNLHKDGKVDNPKPLTDTYPNLTTHWTHRCIQAVVFALHEVLPLGQSFSLARPGGLWLSSTESPDPITLYVSAVEDHIYLVVIQTENDKPGEQITVHVVDSTTGALDLKQRQSLHDKILSMIRGHDPKQCGDSTWIFGPQQTDAWQSGYFAVLNAWSVLLDLRLNTTNFAPKGSFFTDAQQLFQAANNGLADWKLIYAFLRCTNYVHDGRLPPQNRRFTRTYHSADYVAHLRRMSERPRPAEAAGAANIYKHFDAGHRHTQQFPWESQESEDVGFDADLPANLDPCKTFRHLINEHLENKKTKADLKDFRSQERVTTESKEWLEDEEVALAIAAVTIALTENQGPESGFGFMTQMDMQMCAMGEPRMGPVTPRPGRPMLLPWIEQKHVILLIIHLNNKGQPEFSVMDSRPFHFKPEDRERIHNLMYQFAQESQWWNHFADSGTLEANRPTHTTWLPTAMQPGSDECGYYAILNAWSLALGLEPDPKADLVWDEQFCTDIRDLIHLARIGKVSWLMIYAFLRCQRFVRDGNVPKSRQFERTTELRNDKEKYLGAKVDGLVSVDYAYFLEKPKFNRQGLAGANRLLLPAGGRRHDLEVPTDEWDDVEDVKKADELSERGLLDLSWDSEKLRPAYENIVTLRGDKFLHYLRTKYPSKGHDTLQRACQQYMKTWHTEHELRRRTHRILSEESINFYRTLLDSKFLKEAFQTDAFTEPNTTRPLDQVEVNLPLSAVVEALDRLQRDIHSKRFPGSTFAGGFSLSTSTNNETALLVPESMEGIVVSRPRRCFLMPLCLGADAIVPINAERRKDNLDTMSPRRGVGHHLLAVVQEDKDGDFEVIFYDSAEYVFGNSMSYIVEMIQSALPSLHWSTHRNSNTKWSLVRSYPLYGQVPQQKKPWQCGPRTVINGWILAMDLSPNPAAFYDVEGDKGDKICLELFVLARAAIASILNWSTLAAWFFANNLTVERTYDEVSLDRRFTSTRFWTNENELYARILEIYIEDDVQLVDKSVSEVPYQHGNNILRSDYPSSDDDEMENAGESEDNEVPEEVVDDDTEGNDVDEDSENDEVGEDAEDTEDAEDDEVANEVEVIEIESSSSEESPPEDDEVGLPRRMEEPGRFLARRPKRTARNVDALAFLDGYGPGSYARRTKRAKKNVVDKLPFLDGY